MTFFIPNNAYKYPTLPPPPPLQLLFSSPIHKLIILSSSLSTNLLISPFSNPTVGVKTFFQELKAKVSPSRLFKALITESHQVLAKITSSIKSIETVQGDGVAVGCVRQTNFPEGAHFKYVKHRIDAIDTEKYTCKYTLIEGDVLGDKLEKICYDIKFEATEDGGCAIKLTSEYHTKGDVELSEDEIKAGKEQATALYKACEDYLCANPDVCA